MNYYFIIKYSCVSPFFRNLFIVRILQLLVSYFLWLWWHMTSHAEIPSQKRMSDAFFPSFVFQFSQVHKMKQFGLRHFFIVTNIKRQNKHTPKHSGQVEYFGWANKTKLNEIAKQTSNIISLNCRHWMSDSVFDHCPWISKFPEINKAKVKWIIFCVETRNNWPKTYSKNEMFLCTVQCACFGTGDSENWKWGFCSFKLTFALERICLFAIRIFTFILRYRIVQIPLHPPYANTSLLRESVQRIQWFYFELFYDLSKQQIKL